jgi:nitroreductase
MDFLELAKKRYSVRKYQAKKVEEEKLAKILEAGRVAPTGANRQPHRLIVLKENESLKKIKKAANTFDAPLVIIICGNKKTAFVRHFDKKNILDIDVSIVTDHMMMEATELGLGTVWVCYFNPDVIKESFHLPDNIEPINILCIGYADCKEAPANRHNNTRKPLEDIVFYETF